MAGASHCPICRLPRILLASFCFLEQLYVGDSPEEGHGSQVDLVLPEPLAIPDGVERLPPPGPGQQYILYQDQ